MGESPLNYTNLNTSNQNALYIHVQMIKDVQEKSKLRVQIRSYIGLWRKSTFKIYLLVRIGKYDAIALHCDCLTLLKTFKLTQLKNSKPDVTHLLLKNWWSSHILLEITSFFCGLNSRNFFMFLFWWSLQSYYIWLLA